METAVRLKLNITVLILNDNSYGMIRWKQANMGFRDWGLTYGNPDFVKYAESLPELLKGCLNAKGVHLIAIPIDYSDDDLILNRQIKELSAVV